MTYLYLAEMGWPEAIMSCVGSVCFLLFISTIILGRWPWERD